MPVNNSTAVSGALRNRLFNMALFTETTRKHSFSNMLTGDAPKAAKGGKKGKQQTDAGAPIVRITDLSKNSGDEVSVDLVHKVNKRPTMGDRKLAGRGENLTFGDFSMMINQGRHMVDPGGRMSAQRTQHSLRSTARTLLGSYYNDLEDELVTYHLAGARGDLYAADSIVPIESDDEFSEILVNPLAPPTASRHLYGGDAADFESIDSADLFSLGDVDNLALMIDELDFAMQPVRFDSDQMAKDSPFYVLSVTPRQWHDFYTSTSGSDWQTLLATASTRGKNFNHPVFRGECAMWRNILVRKMGPKVVQFNTGSTVAVSNNDADATTSDKTAGTTIHRSLLLGSQALANAYGKSGNGAMGHHFKFHEEETDHGNTHEQSISWMNGKAKIRFQDKRGWYHDHGVIALDTAVSTS